MRGSAHLVETNRLRRVSLLNGPVVARPRPGRFAACWLRLYLQCRALVSAMGGKRTFTTAMMRAMRSGKEARSMVEDIALLLEVRKSASELAIATGMVSGHTIDRFEHDPLSDPASTSR